jgi:hypothetical protein
LPWEGELPTGAHTIDLLDAVISAKPKFVDITGAALLEVRLETTSFPAPIEAKPLLAPPPAPAASVATPGPPPPAPQKRPRIGVMLGLVSLPRPIQVEATFRPFDLLSLSAQYSMLPDLTAPGGSASLQLRAYQGIVRFFPFSGSFFIGSGLGFQTFRASLTTEVQGGTLVTTADASAPFVSPQLGWLFVWESGFTLGITLGVQFSLPQEPKLPATYNGQPVPDMPGPGVPSEVVERVEESREEIRTLAHLATKYPLPNLDLLRIGFFF